MTLDQYAQSLEGPIARAVQDGYDVRTACIDHFVAQLPAQSKHLTTNGLPSVIKRPAPTAQAFEILDKLVELADQLNGPDEFQLADWQVSRATWSDGSKTTVITAYLLVPQRPIRLLVWDAE